LTTKLSRLTRRFAFQNCL